MIAYPACTCSTEDHLSHLQLLGQALLVSTFPLQVLVLRGQKALLFSLDLRSLLLQGCNDGSRPLSFHTLHSHMVSEGFL